MAFRGATRAFPCMEVRNTNWIITGSVYSLADLDPLNKTDLVAKNQQARYIKNNQNYRIQQNFQKGITVSSLNTHE